ncbi:uncharacterized protein PRCAT00000222001 [Priceomyces carsonii]|uniref:uncharacterized protein n=1 Tax=Priceomyces carsonii TaxID=28549 RepID=UPI002ED8D0E0|nr:unnamed protein product [Priceomyces carsonii]
MSEIQLRLPPTVNHNPVHPNAKTTTHVSNGTTTTKTNITSPVCRNCKTQTTPLWRRDETGQVLCNACGLFLKLHGRPRPISLKTDTIKSRNRIKQPNSTKSSGPNTPELKSKDSKQVNNNVKKSPKAKKKSSALNITATDANSLTPLLPAANGGRGLQNTQNASQGLPHPSFHLANHLQQQVQPLHYPSSTPTQFAPGLQRITSPLLLSSTSSISHARSSSGNNPNNNAAVQAASTLENMSHELGPSATFKSSESSETNNGVSLMNNSLSSASKDPSLVLSTPSTALNPNPQPIPPKLPSFNSAPNSGASSAAISSPSFGPQFHLQASQAPSLQTSKLEVSPVSEISARNDSPDLKNMSLPPISKVSSVSHKAPLPHFQNSFGNFNSHLSNNQSQSFNESNDNSNLRNDDGLGNRGNRSNRDNNDKNHDVTHFKTRISELELVNDLYRTRIMELEAMEQAARLRENSMRKRLDEILNLQDKSILSLKRESEEQSASPAKRSRLDI